MSLLAVALVATACSTPSSIGGKEGTSRGALRQLSEPIAGCRSAANIGQPRSLLVVGAPRPDGSSGAALVRGDGTMRVLVGFPAAPSTVADSCTAPSGSRAIVVLKEGPRADGPPYHEARYRVLMVHLGSGLVEPITTIDSNTVRRKLEGQREERSGIRPRIAGFTRSENAVVRADWAVHEGYAVDSGEPITITEDSAVAWWAVDPAEPARPFEVPAPADGAALLGEATTARSVFGAIEVTAPGRGAVAVLWGRPPDSPTGKIEQRSLVRVQRRDGGTPREVWRGEVATYDVDTVWATGTDVLVVQRNVVLPERHAVRVDSTTGMSADIDAGWTVLGGDPNALFAYRADPSTLRVLAVGIVAPDGRVRELARPSSAEMTVKLL